MAATVGARARAETPRVEAVAISFTQNRRRLGRAPAKDAAALACQRWPSFVRGSARCPGAHPGSLLPHRAALSDDAQRGDEVGTEPVGPGVNRFSFGLQDRNRVIACCSTNELRAPGAHDGNRTRNLQVTSDALPLSDTAAMWWRWRESNPHLQIRCETRRLSEHDERTSRGRLRPESPRCGAAPQARSPDSQCHRQESNLHAQERRPLEPVRLPIPPRWLTFKRWNPRMELHHHLRISPITVMLRPDRGQWGADESCSALSAELPG